MFWNRRYAGDDDDSLPGSSISTKATQPDDSGSLMLQNSGRIVEMQSNPHTVRAHGGLIRKLENYSMRGRHWPYTSSCVDAHAGNFAVSDDRGQVYALNVHDNNYKLVRSASSAVCAMCFIPCRSNQLIVSYESGQVLLVDKDSKEIIGNIQSETSGFAPVRLIRSHPTKAMAILASEDGVVALWDLRKMACKLSLECDEPILDVRFELNGSLVMLALQESGKFIRAIIINTTTITMIVMNDLLTPPSLFSSLLFPSLPPLQASSYTVPMTCNYSALAPCPTQRGSPNGCPFKVMCLCL